MQDLTPVCHAENDAVEELQQTPVINDSETVHAREVSMNIF